MTHLDTEIKQLKESLIDMWELVISQLSKTNQAVMAFDKDLAHEVAANEKRVDAFELKINMDCENILALFNPVANDLRFVLAVLKINYNLERIGDYANSIARLVNDAHKAFDEEGLKDTRINEMFKVGQGMLSDALYGFIKEDMQSVRAVFRTDDNLDKVNRKANKIVACLIAKKTDEAEMFLDLLAIIRKLERVGDQTKNIAEEIIFYVEAKVLRHKKKKEKLEGLE